MSSCGDALFPTCDGCGQRPHKCRCDKNPNIYDCERPLCMSRMDNLRADRDSLRARVERLEAVAEAATKLRVMTADEMETGKPFWVVPCDSYEPLKAAMAALDSSRDKETR